MELVSIFVKIFLCLRISDEPGTLKLLSSSYTMEFRAFKDKTLLKCAASVHYN